MFMYSILFKTVTTYVERKLYCVYKHGHTVPERLLLLLDYILC
jgi:hypothetical protein